VSLEETVVVYFKSLVTGEIYMTTEVTISSM